MKQKIVFLALVAAISSCGSDNTPSISGLLVSNDSVSQGSGSVLVPFSFKYSDSDANINQVIVKQNGDEKTDTVDINGKASGSISGAILIDTTTAGTKTGEVFAMDAEGNESNHLDFEITVE